MAGFTGYRKVQRNVIRIDTLIVVGLVTGHAGVRQVVCKRHAYYSMVLASELLLLREQPSRDGVADLDVARRDHARDRRANFGVAEFEARAEARRSGEATLVAMVSGLAPARRALTEIAGRSNCGRGDTGSWK